MKIYRFISITIASGFLIGTAMAQNQEPLTLTRLDCGTFQVNDLNLLSDVGAYPGKSKRVTGSCYLIQHGTDYVLWDAGLPSALKNKPLNNNQPISATLNKTVLEQLGTLGVDPAKIKYVGVSHNHFDHVGQLSDFAQSTLLIGKSDWDAVKENTTSDIINPKFFEPWLTGKSKLEKVMGDKDMFGDGSVVMLSTPGHTPGHHILLIRLVNSGPIILTGDAAHFTENYKNNGVPTFNTNRAETLASLDRIKGLAKNLGAKVIIQHEPADIDKLPAFPAAAN